MENMEGLEVMWCEKCPALVDSRSQIVNGTGPEDADLVFIGEGPGEREDLEGEPFVGRSGTILTNVLQKKGLSRSDVRITNCVRCRPPENRDPTKKELANCYGYLDREIALIDPSLIVTLGKVASEHLLERSVAVTNEAGQIGVTEIGGTERRVMICVHPAASLYDQSQGETLERVIAKAASMVGAGDQSQLDEY